MIGPDNRIYITLGQPFNVTPPGKVDLYRKVGIGGIVSFTSEPRRTVFSVMLPVAAEAGAP